MQKKHFNIPVFIPELACPFQCIYCDQKKISGRLNIPCTEEIDKIIVSHLRTFPEGGSDIEIAFFGGNFTGLKIEDQEKFLRHVQPYILNGKISGIRISTRPDYINKQILELLKQYNVKTIELGAQSMDDDVLRSSKRGHTAKDTEKAAKMILKEGFSLGLQMMIGLPGDTLERSIKSGKRIIELGADNTRIYPALVIKGTHLERMYKEGKYKPLSLKEAIRWSKELLLGFEKSDVKVIKLGLHPSKGLLSGEELVAGPFHSSFRELVLTEIWNDILKPLIDKEGEKIVIHVPADQYNYAIGYAGKNKKMLFEKFQKVRFTPGENLKKRMFEVEI